MCLLFLNEINNVEHIVTDVKLALTQFYIQRALLFTQLTYFSEIIPIVFVFIIA